MLRTALTILYMNPTNPCKFQCQQKESQQITKVEIELNNTVNKTNTEVNDLNLQWLRYNIILLMMRSKERQLYSQV